MDYGEFEIVKKNEGKTSAYGLTVRRAVGIGVRPVFSREGPVDPERAAAYGDTVHNLERSAVLDDIGDLVERDSFARRPALVDVLGGIAV